MPLFIDRLPMLSRGSGRRSKWCVPLPIVTTEADATLDGLGRRRVERWKLDTGYDGEAFAWPTHMLAAGMDPRGFIVSSRQVKGAFGPRRELPVRAAELWLVSNLAGFEDRPLSLQLTPGITISDEPGPPSANELPLLGMQALKRAGLKIAIDWRKETFSVWTPGSPAENCRRFVARAATGFRRVELPWQN